MSIKSELHVFFLDFNTTGHLTEGLSSTSRSVSCCVDTCLRVPVSVFMLPISPLMAPSHLEPGCFQSLEIQRSGPNEGALKAASCLNQKLPYV